MGRISRLLYLPKRLGEKLFFIRRALNKTQSEMLDALNQYGDFSTLTQNVVSDYEKNRREPPPLVLYAYAKVANVYIDVLVDDKIELPDKIPAKKKRNGLKMFLSNIYHKKFSKYLHLIILSEFIQGDDKTLL